MYELRNDLIRCRPGHGTLTAERRLTEGANVLILWGLRVIYRTLSRGVFFCRRCGGDREYRHRAGRRYIAVFFIPLVPLMKTGAHVQCLTCKTRYVTEVLKLPTTVQMQVALVAGMRALVAVILRAGDPASPLARRRALDAVTGAGDDDYDEAALEEDLEEPVDTAGPKISALGSQLQVEAREWCLAEAIRIALADGPLNGAERAAAEQLAGALGMTQAQAIGVIALTEQNV
jgi:Tellurite resistance protein TerB